jgi:YhcH/YjgK/YiaL family protein
MIFDKLANAQPYYAMGKKFADAFEFLKNTDFSDMPAGDYVTTIDGVETPFKVKRYDSRPIEDCKFEKHTHCIDLQYMVSGREYFCYAPYGDELEQVDTDPAKDCIYYKDVGSRVELKEGMFALALTNDVHMPELRIGEEAVPVIKAIVKIHAD